jgi:hypothetical protein
VDGNLLTTNDPYAGVTAPRGILSFQEAKEAFGLRVNRVAAPVTPGAAVAALENV